MLLNELNNINNEFYYELISKGYCGNDSSECMVELSDKDMPVAK